MEYASNGKGNLGVTLGAIGTGLGAVNSMAEGLGLFGMGNNNNHYVSRETFDVEKQLIDAKRDNAILTADLSSEKKMVEIFNASTEKTNAVREELRAEIRAVENKVDSNAAAQAVINSQYGSQLNLNTSQIAQLFGLTKLVIPNSSTCPGWGPVTITPANTGTTIG